jgi:hypothetical protein
MIVYQFHLRCIANKYNPGETASGNYKGFTTLWEAYTAAVKKFPERPHFGTRNLVLEDGTLDYSWKTYREVYDLQNALARGKKKRW